MLTTSFGAPLACGACFKTISRTMRSIAWRSSVEAMLMICFWRLGFFVGRSGWLLGVRPRSPDGSFVAGSGACGFRNQQPHSGVFDFLLPLVADPVVDNQCRNG